MPLPATSGRSGWDSHDRVDPQPAADSVVSEKDHSVAGSVHHRTTAKARHPTAIRPGAGRGKLTMARSFRSRLSAVLITATPAERPNQQGVGTSPKLNAWAPNLRQGPKTNMQTGDRVNTAHRSCPLGAPADVFKRHTPPVTAVPNAIGFVTRGSRGIGLSGGGMTPERLVPHPEENPGRIGEPGHFGLARLTDPHPRTIPLLGQCLRNLCGCVSPKGTKCAPATKTNKQGASDPDAIQSMATHAVAGPPGKPASSPRANR